MAKLADAIAASRLRQGPRCTVSALIAELSDEERADLEAAFADRFVPASAISRGLEAIGHKITEYTLNRHRRGACGCPR